MQLLDKLIAAKKQLTPGGVSGTPQVYRLNLHISVADLYELREILANQKLGHFIRNVMPPQRRVGRNFQGQFTYNPYVFDQEIGETPEQALGWEVPSWERTKYIRAGVPQ